MNLTDEQLNIAICEWRGICPEGWFGVIGPDGEDLPSHITGIEALGNMHEAEKGLDERQYIQWAIHLNQLWLDDNHGSRIVRSASATARQRAIALLRVVKPGVFV